MTGTRELLASLGVIAACLAGAWWLMRRAPRRAGSAETDLTLRLVKRIQVGPRQGIGIVQAGERMLVVALAEGGMQLIAELDRPGTPEPAADRTPAPAGLARMASATFAGAMRLAEATVPNRPAPVPVEATIPMMRTRRRNRRRGFPWF